MTDDPREKLPQEIRDAFAQRDQRNAPTQATRDQLFARIESSISTMDGPPARAPSLVRRALPYAATFTVGAIAGAILYALASAPHQEPAPRQLMTAPVPSSDSHDAGTRAPDTHEAPVLRAPSTPVETQRRSRVRDSDAGIVTSSFANATTHDATLAAERVQLEMARTALRRGEANDALSLLEQHEREFPRGSLREEREALLVLAYASTHQNARAAAQASRFRENFPESVFLPVVNHAMQSISSQTDGATPNAR